MVGSGVGSVVTEAGTLGSYGIMTIPSISAGILVGSSVSSFLDIGFDGIEKQIWGEAK